MVAPTDIPLGVQKSLSQNGITTSPVTTEKILPGDFLETSWRLPGSVHRFI
jgi:hypothetical protein